jgi:hypothetical protein
MELPNPAFRRSKALKPKKQKIIHYAVKFLFANANREFRNPSRSGKNTTPKNAP